MPEPRDPLLKVLTYSVQKTQRGHTIQEFGLPPAGAPRGAGGRWAGPGAARRSNGKGKFTMVWSFATL